MIYIQATEENLPHHFDCSCALYGAIETNQKYKLLTYDELLTGKFDKFIKTNLFVGSVEFMTEVFKRGNIQNYGLKENSNRNSQIKTLEEVKCSKDIFIKPLQTKLFTGLVLNGMNYSFLSELPGNTLVRVYEPFKYKIVSEWRNYIMYNKIIDSRFYSGDFKYSPNYSYIKEVIKNNINFPVCYTIDSAILENGENVVVEYNDMWAIGNYGLPNDIYLRMLKERYFEIIRKNSN